MRCTLNLVGTPSRLLSILKPYLLFLFNKSIRKPSKALITSTNTIMTSSSESDVGISCYISNLPGFRGILKQRYSDFIVNEVDCDGNVAYLTSLKAPPEVIEVKENKIAVESDKSYTSEIESFRSLAGDTDAECLKGLIDQIASSGTEDGVPPIVLSPSSDKSHRTAMHNFFKKRLKFLVTDTVDGPDATSKCIRVRLDYSANGGISRNSKKRKERYDKPFDKRGSDNWQEEVGKFLRFHLYKENKDTHEAINLIGKMLGLQPRSFGFAGTKDKRAVTTQRVTVFKQHASKVAALNDRLIGIKVGNFCYVKEGLVLGQLLGNRFTITLRGVVADSEDTIKAGVDSLGKHGFINYFGLQRFGSGSVSTHAIGATLLRGEWKAAVSLILDPREGERDTINMTREYYKESGDVEGTLKQLPRHLGAEKAVLQSLKKFPGNYLQALKTIPRTLRMMYVHSYQSYLWNHAVSVRLQKYGSDRVVLGDLVYCKEGDCTGIVAEIDKSECEDETSIDCSNPDEISETDVAEDIKYPVKPVTAEDLQSGKYNVEDVILPLPGSRVIYPTNEVAEVYHDLAKKEAISLAESAHNVKEFSITSMTGGYRRVIQKPIDFEWELLTYTDSNKALAETDFEKISKSKSVSILKKEDESNNGNISEDCLEQSEPLKDVKPSTGWNFTKCIQGEGMPQGTSSNNREVQMALKLAFTLPSSCYATIAIRELLKTSTSVAFHKTLN